MQPSEKSIAEFLSFAPEAGEGNAFVFLEVQLLSKPKSFLTRKKLTPDSLREQVQ